MLTRYKFPLKVDHRDSPYLRIIDFDDEQVAIFEDEDTADKAVAFLNAYHKNNIELPI
jgi:hypothetical protein